MSWTPRTETDQTPGDSPDGESDVVGEESKDSEGEGVPFYY